jgi:hypothetical protein
MVPGAANHADVRGDRIGATWQTTASCRSSRA